MNLTKCANGHFYDGDKFPSCPHCKGGAASSPEESVTMSYDTAAMPTESAASDISGKTMNDGAQNTSNAPTVKLVTIPTEQIIPQTENDSTKTVRFYEADMNIEPVVGWLVALSGKEKGKSYVLKAGPNFIGRDSSMDVTIEDDRTVSRYRHAVVIYDPKSRRFFALPGEAKALFYLDDEVVLNNVEIKERQILTIGETRLMLVSFCNKEFAWEDIKEDEDEQSEKK